MSGNETNAKIPNKIHRGLKGVYFDRSATSKIDGQEGELWYRGYSIHDLAAKSTFEEVTYLLIEGELPMQEQLAAFDTALKGARRIPSEVIEVIRLLKDAHPMEVLRTAVSSLGPFDEDFGDNSQEALKRISVRLTAQVPTIVAAHQRLRGGQEPVTPSGKLSHAANFLYMLRGEVPSEDAALLMDKDFILHAEHGANASSFTARVVAGTNANMHASVTAAIGALSGPSHGGAAEDVMMMAEEIGEPSRAKEFVAKKRAAKEPITGFGHRVYKVEDPRARHMRDGVRKLSEEMGEPKWFNILQAVVEAMEPYAKHGIRVNVDFYSGVAYYLHDIPIDLFVSLFAIGRVPGWSAQIIEQMENNILIRPLTEYSGSKPRPYIDMNDRSERLKAS
jgi:citrate synthase